MAVAVIETPPKDLTARQILREFLNHVLDGEDEIGQWASLKSAASLSEAQEAGSSEAGGDGGDPAIGRPRPERPRP